MKKIISVFVAVMMIVSLMSVCFINASAELVAASIGTQNYGTLKEALAAVKNGETIKIEIDLPNETEKLMVNYDTEGAKANETALSFTIDGNGKKITTVLPDTAATTDGYLCFYNCTVTIKNLSFVFSAGQIANGKLGCTAVNAYEGSDLTIDNVNISSKLGDGIYCENSKMLIKDSTIITEKDNLGPTHNTITTNKGADITIQSGTFKCLNEETGNVRALIRTNGATDTTTSITINDGTFESFGGRFFYENGTAGTILFTVNGGTYTLGDLNDSFKQSSGTESVITINGGTFTKNGSATKLFKQQSKKTAQKIAINGGTFNASESSVFDPDYSGTIQILGGTFNSNATDVAFIEEKIVAPSTGAKSNENKTLVVSDPTATTAPPETSAPTGGDETTGGGSADKTGDASRVIIIASIGVVAFVGTTVIVMKKKEENI